MPSDNIQRLHKVYTSGIYPRDSNNPAVDKLLDEPHLAIFINGDWLPVLPGMVIGLVKNRRHVDGVAPYFLSKVSLKPGKEYIDLVAWSTDGRSDRTLRLGAKYAGKYVSGIRDADEAVDAAMASQKMGDDNDSE